MTKWRLLIVMVTVWGQLVCVFGQEFPCKAGQIHWKPNSTSGKQHKCLECPYCPEGSEPSVPCGSSVPYKTPVHCVPCQLGKTYSDKYVKEQCKACTVCSLGKAIKKNCTLTSNTECDDKCAHEYYKAPFIFGCHPCTECCNDTKDEIAQECANSEKKCKVPSTPCKKESKPSITAGTVGQSTFSTQKTNHKLGKHASAIPPTSSGNSRVVDGGDRLANFQNGNTNDDNDKTTITVATVFAALGMLMGIIIVMVLVYQGRIHMCRWDRSSNNDGAVDAYQLRPISTSQEQLPQDDMTLRELESNNLDLFDQMCLMLDDGKRCFRWDYERLAALYKDIPLVIRNSLKSEFRREGSPSKMLMSKLQTIYPELTLRHLVWKLKQIGRNDIAQTLMPHVQKNEH